MSDDSLEQPLDPGLSYTDSVATAGTADPSAELRRVQAENAALREALEPFAVIGRAIRNSATDKRWLETPLFRAGTAADPNSMTLTGRAFDNAAAAIEALRKP